jgi:hypothetical protein
MIAMMTLAEGWLVRGERDVLGEAGTRTYGLLTEHMEGLAPRITLELFGACSTQPPLPPPFNWAFHGSVRVLAPRQAQTNRRVLSSLPVGEHRGGKALFAVRAHCWGCACADKPAADGGSCVGTVYLHSNSVWKVRSLPSGSLAGCM